MSTTYSVPASAHSLSLVLAVPRVTAPSVRVDSPPIASWFVSKSVFRYFNPNEGEVSFTTGIDGEGYLDETDIEAGEYHDVSPYRLGAV